MAGNAIAATDVAGRITRTYYDNANRPYAVVQNLDPAWGITTANPPQPSSAHLDQNLRYDTVYDASGNLIAAYDALNRPYAVVQNLTAQGYGVETPPNRSASTSDENILTDTVYDDAGRVMAAVDPLGRVTRTYYDALNRPVAVVKNLVGNIYAEQWPAYNPDTSDQNVRMETAYDDFGNQIAVREILAEDDPIVTRTYYDILGRQTSVVRNLTGWAIENDTPPAFDPAYPDQNVRMDSVYDAQGNAIAAIEWMERNSEAITITTRTYYDSLGRTVAVVRNLTGDISASDWPDFNPSYPDQNVRTETVYDLAGNVIATREILAESNQILTRTYYDGLSRTVTVVQNLTGQTIEEETPPTYNPAYPEQNVRADTAYDASGSAIATIEWLAEGGSTVSRITRTYYDRLDRPVTTVQNLVGQGIGVASAPQRNPNTPDQNVRTDTVNDRLGNRISSTDPNGIVTRFEYDGQGRLAAVVENYLSGVNPDQETNVRTEYGYDAAGNRLSILDGNQHTTIFTYDELDRLESESDALSHTTSYGYDALGNQAALTDANGAETHFVYDHLGRLESVDYPNPDVDVSYTYNALGWRTVMADGIGNTTWDYDFLGRAIEITDPYTGTVGYEFDALGNRLMLVYPDQKQVTYTYDALHRLRTVTDWDSQVTTYTYTTNGQPLETQLPDGVTSSYTYDALGRLTLLTHATQSSSLSSFQYGYDLAGNRTVVTETLSTGGVPDMIFADGFESGDLSAWSASTTDGGDLSVTAQAAIAGSFGMQAVIDDNTAIYVSDNTPEAETRYRARFYFDPNSIAMASGDAHYLLYGYQGETTGVVRLEFGAYLGDYRARASVLNDSDVWTNTEWVVLPDQMHYLELDWRAAVSQGTNDGELTLWVDGQQAGALTGLDNDTRRIDRVTLGAVTGIDPGTRGTYYFDVFGSRRVTYIGAEPGAPEPPEPPSLSDDFFDDGFESGDFSGWTFYTPDPDLAVTSGAALAGQYGMQLTVDDTDVLYVMDSLPESAQRYRARFAFDPNSLQIPSMYPAFIFAGTFMEGEAQTTAVVVGIYADPQPGYYHLGAFTYNDDTTQAIAEALITDDVHIVEVDWRAASAPGANDGRLALWVDGALIDEVTGIDNDTYLIEDAYLGVIPTIPGTQGTPYFDAFEAHSQTYLSGARSLGPLQLGWETETQGSARLASLTPEFSVLGSGDLAIRLTEVLAPKTLTAASNLLAPLASQPRTVEPAPQAQSSATTITYTYDPLYRLTGADYSSGDSFEYTYDSVGNRLSETACTGTSCTPTTTNYVYDHANRLTSVGGVSYAWDDNGNLLSDGVNTYTYDHANRLTGIQGTGTQVAFGYNGEGDRLQQTADSVTTSYTLDLNAGLTQVLSDGANTYLYGAGRIAQQSAAGKEYFLGDALGSVRQLADATGAVSLARSYQPYGKLLASDGSSATSFGFTNEYTDVYIELVYLRSRYYSLETGRFITRDGWQGDNTRPMSYNAWQYAYTNPIRYTDPSGQDVNFPGDDPSNSSPDARDLTDWLYRELIANANGPEVHRWKTWNTIAKILAAGGGLTCLAGKIIDNGMVIAAGGVVIVGGVAFHAAALKEYGEAVKDGAIWDFKDETGRRLGPGITLCTTGRCYNDIEFSVPGNIHFAYIGAAAGIFSAEINIGAAYAEIRDPAHDPASKQYIGPYVGPDELREIFGETWWDPGTWNFGDEPIDHEAVNLGIRLWKKFKGTMSLSQFKSELSGKIGSLARCSPDPKPVEKDVAEFWPYRLGYFNNVGNTYKLDPGRCP